VEWIATQNGKVRASSDKKGTTSRWSAAEEKNRRRKKNHPTRPRASRRRL
jgi:hypothetical protein